MPKSDQSRINYAARRDMRLRRDKTAAALMPAFLQEPARAGSEASIRAAAELAVKAADILLGELDKTRKEIPEQQP